MDRSSGWRGYAVQGLFALLHFGLEGCEGIVVAEAGRSGLVLDGRGGFGVARSLANGFLLCTSLSTLRIFEGAAV